MQCAIFKRSDRLDRAACRHRWLFDCGWVGLFASCQRGTHDKIDVQGVPQHGASLAVRLKHERWPVGEAEQLSVTLHVSEHSPLGSVVYW